MARALSRRRVSGSTRWCAGLGSGRGGMVSDEKKVRKQTAHYDLFNRLHSIRADCAFVQLVAHEWYDGRFEVVANQRCGSWYCDPTTSSAVYAYFKSTDGHTRKWDFNLRRSNLPLASYAETKGGLLIVDSTRRGKRMPDALSKTIPIWCCVINRAVYRKYKNGGTQTDDEQWDGELYTPAGIVAPTEKAQMEALLEKWTDSLVKSSLTLPELGKPLRPFFLHPSTVTPPLIPSDSPYTPIICLSASRWNGNAMQADTIPTVTTLGDGFWARKEGFDYVPGAGDDDELWARGLTPALFHKHKGLLAVDREDLPRKVEELVAAHSAGGVLEGIELLSVASADGEIGERISPLVGLPHSSSRLAVDIGPPAITRQSWEGSLLSSVVLHVCTVDKVPKDGPIRLLRTDGDHRDFVLYMPTSKAENRTYLSALQIVLYFARDLLNKPDTTLVLQAAKSALRQGTNRQPTTRLGPSVAIAAADMTPEVTETEMITARKTIIPIALLLLCAVPGGDGQRPDPTSLVKVDTPNLATADMDKAKIARTLHTLVTLWPDGNPPRAALKRVNELLLSAT